MPQLPIGMKKVRKPQTIFLAVWEHKHGQDVSAHTTKEGAFKQCTKWAREALEDWQDDSYKKYTDEDLFWGWPEITGETEFLTINETLLHEGE